MKKTVKLDAESAAKKAGWTIHIEYSNGSGTHFIREKDYVDYKSSNSGKKAWQDLCKFLEIKI